MEHFEQCTSPKPFPSPVAQIELGLLPPPFFFFFHLALMILFLTCFIWYTVIDDVFFQWLTLWALFTQVLFWIFKAAVSLMIWRDFEAAKSEQSTSNGASEGEIPPLAFAVGEHGGLGSRLGRQLSPWTKAMIFHRDRFWQLLIPIATFVCILYWSILFEGFTEPGYNFRTTTSHGMTLVGIALDTFLQRSRPLPSAWRELLYSFVYTVAYLIFNMCVYAVAGYWVYPIIQEPLASSPAVGVFGYIGLIVVFLVFLYLWRVINLVYWRSLDEQKLVCDLMNFSCGPLTYLVPEPDLTSVVANSAASAPKEKSTNNNAPEDV